MANGYWRDGTSVNQRINIKYKEGEPKVIIGKEGKKHEHWITRNLAALLTVFFVAMMITSGYIVILTFYQAFFIQDQYLEAMEDGKLSTKQYSKYINSPEFIRYEFVDTLSTNPNVIVPIFLMNFYGFVPIFLSYKLWQKKKNKGMINPLTNYYYLKVFKEVPKEGYVEIPLFYNDQLDFEAKGEFSDYLKEVDIREYPFEFVKNKQKKENGKYWFARFYFFKQPTNGELEVRFK